MKKKQNNLFSWSMLGFLVLIAAVISCNDQNSTAAKKDQAASTIPVQVDNSNVLQPTETLSASELLDDSVFTDGSIPSSWENAGITDVKGLKLFLKDLQQQVMLNDKEKLASHIKYPLKDIQSKEQLVARYDEVFTKAVKLSFAGINFSQLFRNQNGVMTQGGKVWISQFGDTFKIIAINY